MQALISQLYWRSQDSGRGHIPEGHLRFARLSVFAGGCTFEAADAVCSPDGAIDPLERLTSLVEQSLVRAGGEAEPRFVMLETLREDCGRNTRLATRAA